MIAAQLRTLKPDVSRKVGTRSSSRWPQAAVITQQRLSTPAPAPTGAGRSRGPPRPGRVRDDVWIGSFQPPPPPAGTAGKSGAPGRRGARAGRAGGRGCRGRGGGRTARDRRDEGGHAVVSRRDGAVQRPGHEGGR